MAFSPLADMSRRIPDGGRSWARNAPPVGVGYHHNAGVDAFGEASNPAREVSANYWILNDGTIIPNIDEDRRPFTSAHEDYPAGLQADMRLIMLEISNSPEGVRSKSWAISDAALRSVIRLTAEIHKRRKLGTIKRSAADGVGVHSDWVDTECPGDYVRSKLPYIIREANRLNTGGLTMSDYEKLADKIDKLHDHVSNQARVTRGSSQIGWLKAKVWQLLHRDQPIEVNIDAAELAAEIREALGDDRAAEVASMLQITVKGDE